MSVKDNTKYLYTNHLYGGYFLNDDFDGEYIPCNECGDSDDFIGEVHSDNDIISLIINDRSLDVLDDKEQYDLSEETTFEFNVKNTIHDINSNISNDLIDNEINNFKNNYKQVDKGYYE